MSEQPERASTTAPITVLGNIADTITDGFGQNPKTVAREIVDELSRAGYEIRLTDDLTDGLGRRRLSDTELAEAEQAIQVRSLLRLVRATGADVRVHGVRITREVEDTP